MSPAECAGQETQNDLNVQTKNPPWHNTKGDLSHLASRSMVSAGGFQLDELDPDSGGLTPGLTHLVREHLDGQCMPQQCLDFRQ